MTSSCGVRWDNLEDESVWIRRTADQSESVGLIRWDGYRPRAPLGEQAARNSATSRFVARVGSTPRSKYAEC